MPKNQLAVTLGLLMLTPALIFAQPCTPQGDPSVYGINNVWIGYVYDNADLTNYKGYVTEGTIATPNFDRDFGGAYVNYPTNGCDVYTEAFSVRYRLIKTFPPGDYDFTVAADDGYRLSIDGGATWLINSWVFTGFIKNTVTVTLAGGNYNLVLEYFDYAHNNRISFAVSNACMGVENTNVYGSNNVWKGYVYNGTGFEYYKGLKNEGTGASADFDESFGGSTARFLTSTCALLAEHFTVRYRLTKTFPPNNYSIIIASEDGYRFSIDGGTTWLIDNWSNTSFTSSTIMANLSGSYSLVLEYKETTGPNRIAFSAGAATLLPVDFVSFTGRNTTTGVALQWETGGTEDAVDFEVERSDDGSTYQRISIVNGHAGINKFSYSDPTPLHGQAMYRIRMKDASGKIKYSRPITVMQNEKGIRIYPTLINNGTVYISNNVRLASPQIFITDMAGRIVCHHNINTLAAGQTTSLYLQPNLLKGVYLLHFRVEGIILKTEKIVIR